MKLTFEQAQAKEKSLLDKALECSLDIHHFLKKNDCNSAIVPRHIVEMPEYRALSRKSNAALKACRLYQKEFMHTYRHEYLEQSRFRHETEASQSAAIDGD
jgi:hypothetical protein